MTGLTGVIAMHLQAFRYFVTTAESGSIRAASERLHVAPSAISRQIALLEEEFEAALFERHAAGMSLTAAGALLVREARAILRDVERMRSEVDSLQGLRRGHIRICSSEGAVANLLFLTMRDFCREHPGITIEIVTSGSRTALDALLNQTCDIAVVFDPEINADIEVVRSSTQPACVVAKADDKRLQRKTISVNQLMALRPCLLDHSFGVRRLFERVVAETGASVNPALTINSVELAKRFAALGLGVALMPLYAVTQEVRDGQLKTARIDHPYFNQSTVALCKHKRRVSPVAARAFLNALSDRFDKFALS
jgi:DNA-binding transcriptional LysR family regulator